MVRTGLGPLHCLVEECLSSSYAGLGRLSFKKEWIIATDLTVYKHIDAFCLFFFKYQSDLPL